MKHIRMFENAQQAAAILAELQYPTLSAIRGESGIVMKPGMEPGPDLTIPFYIEDISGSENTIRIKKTDSAAPTITIEKSLDGINWENMGSTSAGTSATIPANGKLYLRCSTERWGSVNSYGNAITATGNCNVGGNIMSLLYGSNFTGEETTFPSGSQYNFIHLFNNNTKLINASELILPVTTLTTECYRKMFTSCTSLITAPALPATTLAPRCYNQMFSSCTSLTTAPALPATILTQSCYNTMFSQCTALTAAPELPATTLAANCYQSMFYGCTGLISAPELPATTLTNYCYSQMFWNCTNLNYIKCLATDISASSCTTNWVNNIAATGIFVKAAGVTWGSGVNGIPEGWTVQEV